jgi:hypothetical protein
MQTPQLNSKEAKFTWDVAPLDAVDAEFAATRLLFSAPGNGVWGHLAREKGSAARLCLLMETALSPERLVAGPSPTFRALATTTLVGLFASAETSADAKAALQRFVDLSDAQNRKMLEKASSSSEFNLRHAAMQMLATATAACDPDSRFVCVRSRRACF